MPFSKKDIIRATCVNCSTDAEVNAGDVNLVRPEVGQPSFSFVHGCGALVVRVVPETIADLLEENFAVESSNVSAFEIEDGGDQPPIDHDALLDYHDASQDFVSLADIEPELLLEMYREHCVDIGIAPDEWVDEFAIDPSKNINQE